MDYQRLSSFASVFCGWRQLMGSSIIIEVRDLWTQQINKGQSSATEKARFSRIIGIIGPM